MIHLTSSNLLDFSDMLFRNWSKTEWHRSWFSFFMTCLDMLILCTENVHFTFKSRKYVQTDGVALGSPLGPVFMIEIENSLLPNLTKYITWSWFVDDTVCFLKIGSPEFVISVLNRFGKNIYLYSSVLYMEFRAKFTACKKYLWNYTLRRKFLNLLFIDLIIKSPFLPR